MFNLDLRPDCASCGLSYRFIDTGDGPAVFVIMIVGFVIVGLVLAVELSFQPPIWLHLVLSNLHQLLLRITIIIISIKL